MAMDLQANELLPGERVVLSKKANCVVGLSEVGLQRLPYDHAMQAIGFGGREAIGGQLHLTSYRLVFASHAINRAVGKLSLFLPSVVELRDTSRGLTKKFVVRTSLQEVELVVWGIPALITAIEEQRRTLSPADASALLGQIGQAPQVVGDAFTISKAVDLIARNVVEFAAIAGASAADPLAMASLLGLWELAHGGE